MMTIEEARDELMKRFPSTSVCANVKFWLFNTNSEKRDDYEITFFVGKECYIKTGSSFEDCFKQIDNENEEINKVIKEKSILFRIFKI
jgi:hypothetical protein